MVLTHTDALLSRLGQIIRLLIIADLGLNEFKISVLLLLLFKSILNVSVFSFISSKAFSSSVLTGHFRASTSAKL